VNVCVLRVAATALALCALASCGKKGPPLPPLHIVPDMVTEVVARRVGDEVRIRFVLPAKNANGPNPVNLSRVDVFAVTLAPGAAAPPNREFLSQKFLVGRIDAEPPAVEGQPAGAEDPRPAPGEPAAFVEKLTPAVLTPQVTVKPEPPADPAAAAAAAAEPAAQAPTRLYAIRGAARNGRPGQPSARIQVPLGDLPQPPASFTVDFDEKALKLSWVPPVVSEGGKPLQFNIYTPTGAQPINTKPVAAPAFERAGVEFGKEECFVVRAVEQHGAVQIESDPTPAQCVTPQDRFPPIAPKGLVAVASAGAVNLIWEANADPDLGGYLVLRGEAPGDTLQPVTASPIQDTTYRDTSVTPGVRYVYAIVAVDQAKPPNVSAQSERVEETARVP
jgi:hypothetical protein